MSQEHADGQIEVTVLLPCLNEHKTVVACVKEALAGIAKAGVVGEVLVVDNGSTDDSVALARGAGARVVEETQKGYGSALRRGISEAKGIFVVMGDADSSYDFMTIDQFVPKLREGYDMVMGNRFKGGIDPGAMRPLHKLGNPVLTGILNILFRTGIGDAHCGMRAFNKKAALSWDLRTLGMEFASELVVKAALHNAKITEVPCHLRKDGRGHPSHLRSFRDGWRHLRYLLLMSPSWVLAVPGAILTVLGLGIMLWLSTGSHMIGAVRFDVNMMVFGAMCAAIGYQLLLLWICARMFGWRSGLLPATSSTPFFEKNVTLERGVILGVIEFMLGVIVSALLLRYWYVQGFGELNMAVALRYALWGFVLLMLGIQTISQSFFLGFLLLQTGGHDRDS